MEILIVIGQLIAIVILLSVVVFILIPLAVYFNARADKQFTTLPEGEIKYIVEGDTLKRILINVPGYDIKGEGMDSEIVPRAKESKEEHKQEVGLPGWFSKLLGLGGKRIPIYFVGIDYPKTRVHVYEYVWDKFIKEQTTYEIEHRDEFVNSLYWRYPYPVEAKEVELEGNFKIDITIIATIQVVHPYKPVFIHKGRWFSHVIAAIQGAVVSYCGIVNFETLRGEDKETKDARLVKAVMSINPYLIENYGVKVSQVNFVEIEPSIAQEGVLNALQAIEIARLHADAKVKEAEGERKAAVLRRTGESEGLKKLLKVANLYGQEGLAVLQADLTSRNLGQNSNLQTIVLSGDKSPILPAISIDPKKGNPPKK